MFTYPGPSGSTGLKPQSDNYFFLILNQDILSTQLKCCYEMKDILSYHK